MDCIEPEYPCGGDPDEPCPCGALRTEANPPSRQVLYGQRYVSQYLAMLPLNTGAPEEHP